MDCIGMAVLSVRISSWVSGAMWSIWPIVMTYLPPDLFESGIKWRMATFASGWFVIMLLSRRERAADSSGESSMACEVWRAVSASISSWPVRAAKEEN